jgi:UDP-glucose 4-epimerase
MSILVTGGCGYLGSHTCLALLEAGYDVVALDNFSNSTRASLVRVSELTGTPLKLYQCDVRNGMQMIGILDENEIEAVIHFAALKNPVESFGKPLEYYENNVGGTLTLLRVMAMKGVKKLVFSSSAAVYGKTEGQPVAEETPLCPVSPYGKTKAACEEMIAAYAASDPDFSAVVLRYFNPIGAHPSGRIGESPKQAPMNLLPRLMAAADTGAPLTVTGTDFPTPDGTGQRDYLHVCDVAQGHVLALRALEETKGVTVCNLGTGAPVSVLELIAAFERATGAKVPYELGARREGDAARSWADVTRARQLLGFAAEHTLEEACRDAWRWYCDNPEGYGEDV